jgi:hypothetical protein
LAIDQVDLVQRFLARTPVSYPIAMAGPTGVEWTKKLGNAAGGLPLPWYSIDKAPSSTASWAS